MIYNFYFEGVLAYEASWAVLKLCNDLMDRFIFLLK
jgi:hypothetical protein